MGGIVYFEGVFSSEEREVLEQAFDRFERASGDLEVAQEAEAGALYKLEARWVCCCYTRFDTTLFFASRAHMSGKVFVATSAEDMARQIGTSSLRPPEENQPRV